MFRFAAVFALIAYASGSPIVATPYGLAAPVGIAPAVVKTVEFDAHPQYSFTYSVNDASTGDSKSQSESRDGDAVTGQYSLIEADGTRRIVDYTADDVHGFNAVVRKEGAVAPVAKVIAPAYHAPIAAAYAHAPIAAAYHAPLAAAAYHAPYASPYAAYHHPIAAPVIAKPYYG
ncbi:larval cuticle protein A2B-like [Chironomus tepperi]|uniref:larval cuticle protein A2B-like n=1 Tax=Chironomus tepperi TaxID=113505 RepID=UPI00391EFCFA